MSNPDTSMRVAIVSDLESGDGASNSTSRYCRALCEAGVEVVRIVGRPDGKSHPWKTIKIQDRLREQLQIEMSGRLSQKYAIRARNRITLPKLRAALEEVKPDVINVRNIHKVKWEPEVVDVCARIAPTVWTLHDEWSFTGRCVYAYDCERFQTGCNDECPTADTWPALPPSLIGPAWERRKTIFEAHPNLAAATPSRWMAQRAKSALWKDHTVEAINNAVDLNEYAPLDRELARKALDLDPEGPLIFFVSEQLEEERKGGPLLVEALGKITARPFSLMTMGRGVLEKPDGASRLFSLGYVDHVRMKVLAYSAADLVVHPASVDNLPNVILESVACGTPAVAFNRGGVPEMVVPGKSGWLVDELNAEALARTIDAALNEISNGNDLRDSCRAYAAEQWDVRKMVEQYLSLYRKLACAE